MSVEWRVFLALPTPADAEWASARLLQTYESHLAELRLAVTGQAGAAGAGAAARAAAAAAAAAAQGGGATPRNDAYLCVDRSDDADVITELDGLQPATASGEVSAAGEDPVRQVGVKMRAEAKLEVKVRVGEGAGGTQRREGRALFERIEELSAGWTPPEKAVEAQQWEKIKGGKPSGATDLPILLRQLAQKVMRSYPDVTDFSTLLSPRWISLGKVIKKKVNRTLLGVGGTTITELTDIHVSLPQTGPAGQEAATRYSCRRKWLSICVEGQVKSVFDMLHNHTWQHIWLAAKVLDEIHQHYPDMAAENQLSVIWGGYPDFISHLRIAEEAPSRPGSAEDDDDEESYPEPDDTRLSSFFTAKDLEYLSGIDHSSSANAQHTGGLTAEQAMESNAQRNHAVADQRSTAVGTGNHSHRYNTAKPSALTEAAAAATAAAAAGGGSISTGNGAPLPPSRVRQVAHFVIVLVMDPNTMEYVAIEETGGRGWWFPAGEAEAGEDFMEAAYRECLEEAGLDVSIQGILRLEHDVNGNQERMRIVFFAHPRCYSQEPVALKDTEDEHSVCARWVSRKHLMKIAGQSPGLRTAEIINWIDYLESGGVVFPVEILTDEMAPADIIDPSSCYAVIPAATGAVVSASGSAASLSREDGKQSADASGAGSGMLPRPDPDALVADMHDAVAVGNSDALRRVLCALSLTVADSAALSRMVHTRHLDAKQWTPLHSAIRAESPDCVRLLLVSGADPTATNAMGRNAFHFAAKHDQPAIMNLLITAMATSPDQLRAAVNAIDSSGMSAAEYCKSPACERALASSNVILLA